MGGGFRGVVAGDGYVDNAAGGDGRGEEDGGEFNLGVVLVGSLGGEGLGRADQAFVLCQKDSDAGVDFADGEGYEHRVTIIAIGSWSEEGNGHEPMGFSVRIKGSRGELWLGRSIYRIRQGAIFGIFSAFINKV